MAELEQKLQQLVVSLSCGRKVLTEFKSVKCEIRQRQIKKLQATRVRSRADQLDRKNQVNVAFFERLKENHKRTNIEALKNYKNQILNIAKDKVNVAKRFYEELYGLIPTKETLQYKYLQHVPRVISREHNDFFVPLFQKLKFTTQFVK